MSGNKDDGEPDPPKTQLPLTGADDTAEGPESEFDASRRQSTKNKSLTFNQLVELQEFEKMSNAGRLSMGAESEGGANSTRTSVAESTKSQAISQKPGASSTRTSVAESTKSQAVSQKPGASSTRTSVAESTRSMAVSKNPGANSSRPSAAESTRSLAYSTKTGATSAKAPDAQSTRSRANSQTGATSTKAPDAQSTRSRANSQTGANSIRSSVASSKPGWDDDLGSYSVDEDGEELLMPQFDNDSSPYPATDRQMSLPQPEDFPDDFPLKSSPSRTQSQNRLSNATSKRYSEPGDKERRSEVGSLAGSPSKKNMLSSTTVNRASIPMSEGGTMVPLTDPLVRSESIARSPSQNFMSSTTTTPKLSIPMSEGGEMVLSKASQASKTQLASTQSQGNISMKPAANDVPDVQESKVDRDWMAKFEEFAIKFLNKIFRRTLHERRLRDAVKFPSCRNKRPPGFMPTANAGIYPYSTFAPLPGFQESRIEDTIPTMTEAQEEALVASELNLMLDEIKQVITTISPVFLPQVTPLFQALVGLKSKDFRKTDNRDIFRKVDDYLTLIRCDAHICLETVSSRLRALVEFVNGIKKDSENLKKFPRILTKCYSTESRICQEVCEVYSDDEFQTVNIKKMCKLKPKAPERPPWRLAYKIGRECYPGFDAKVQACTGPQPKCGGTIAAGCGTLGCPAQAPGCGGNETSCCGTCGDVVKKDCGGCKKKCKPIRRISMSCCKRRRRCRTSRRRKEECPCGCCGSQDNIPDICGILFTRFRAHDPDNCPMFVEGHGTECAFPSMTNFKNIRELSIPNQKLFAEEPKCCNPPPTKDNCFGTGGKATWKNKQYPCGAKNKCRKESCKPLRDPRSCCAAYKKKKKKKRKNECGTSTTNLGDIDLKNIKLPPGVSPQEFRTIMTDLYGVVTEQGYGSTVKKACANKDGIRMRGVVATQGGPEVDKQKSQRDFLLKKEKSEQDFFLKQQQDKSDFEQRLIKQRDEFAQKEQKRRQSFEAQHQLQQRTFEQSQEDRKLFDQEVSQEREKFEQGLENQWKAFTEQQKQQKEQFDAQMKLEGDALFDGGQYMIAQMPDQIQNGFRNVALDKELFTDQDRGLLSKQQQTFMPYQEFQKGDGLPSQRSLAQLKEALQMSNNALAGALAKIVHTAGDGPGQISAKQKEDVYSGFIAQMYAAGNISKADAERMSKLVQSKLLLEKTMNLQGITPTRNQKGAQCSLAEVEHYTSSQARLRHDPAKVMHVCDPNRTCPHATLRGYSNPAKIFTSTRTYTTETRHEMGQQRGWQNPDGTWGTGLLRLTQSRSGFEGGNGCSNICNTGTRNPSTEKNPPKSSSPSRIPKLPTQNFSFPACAIKSSPSTFGMPKCPNREWTVPICGPLSQPNLGGGGSKCKPRDLKAIKTDQFPIPDPPPPPIPFRDETPSQALLRSSPSQAALKPSPSQTQPPSGSNPNSSKKPSPVASPESTSPTNERSLSLSSHSPSPQGSIATTEDERIIPPLDTNSGKKKLYTSKFKFDQHKPPEPDCNTAFSILPECHPLKTPYPPQYRFDDVRMRRYMEQCHHLKGICSHPLGEQCWTPPPPPLPPELRERAPPFPDPCSNSLFPGTNLGMGCGYGLSSGNCYGPFGAKLPKPEKPEDCFFDCGGICPMGLLGESCPQPKTPPYSKLKKKKKQDEFFQFDYITVKREKNQPKEESEEFCDIYKRKKDLQKQLQQQGVALPTLEIEVEGPRPGRSKGRRGPMDDNCNGVPLPSDEITRFLLRPDVKVVKEQKTEIVKKQGPEGPEKMVSQIEAYFTRNTDGTIQAEMSNKPKDTDPNANAIDQWVKQEQEANLKKLQRANNFGDECPMRDTDWEKEFNEFARSCNRPKNKQKGPNLKPLPAGFIPCPLPDTPAPIMCRVEDSKNMSGGKTIQCQAIPFPLQNVIGNTLGPDGKCPMVMQIPPFGMPAPQGAYGGFVMQPKVAGQVGNPPQYNQGQGYKYPQAGASKYGPLQPVNSASKTPSQKSLGKKTKKSDDYPYMCEIKYHEPIQGSIYGRVVSRKQPCRLIDPDSGLPKDHDPNCPVIMETPYFNPSCPQKDPSQTKPDKNENDDKDL